MVVKTIKKKTNTKPKHIFKSLQQKIPKENTELQHGLTEYGLLQKKLSWHFNQGIEVIDRDRRD